MKMRRFICFAVAMLKTIGVTMMDFLVHRLLQSVASWFGEKERQVNLLTEQDMLLS